jgi:hypothetical protein
MYAIDGSVPSVGSLLPSFADFQESALGTSVQGVSASASAEPARTDTVTISRLATFLGAIQQRLQTIEPEQLAPFLSGSADDARAAAQQAGNSAEANFLENLAVRLQVAANFPGISALPSFSLSSLFAD